MNDEELGQFADASVDALIGYLTRAESELMPGQLAIAREGTGIHTMVNLMVWGVTLVPGPVPVPSIKGTSYLGGWKVQVTADDDLVDLHQPRLVMEAAEAALLTVAARRMNNWFEKLQTEEFVEQLKKEGIVT